MCSRAIRFVCVSADQQHLIIESFTVFMFSLEIYTLDQGPGSRPIYAELARKAPALQSFHIIAALYYLTDDSLHQAQLRITTKPVQAPADIFRFQIQDQQTRDFFEVQK
jgi:hypothetical protein